MSNERGSLFRRVSQSIFWNAALLPLVSVLNLVAAVLIRRYFGLESGLYDVLLGLLNTILFCSALGIPVSFTQFLPRLESAAGRAGTVSFLRRAGSIRLGLAALALVPVNLLAPRVAEWLHLGDGGLLLLRILSALVLLRAANELLVRTLQSFLAHLQANLLLLLQALAIAATLAATFTAGLGMPAVMGALIGAAGLVLLAGLTLVRRHLATLRPTPDRQDVSNTQVSTFWRFSLFMYVYELSNYFAAPAFASTALGAVSPDRAPVALFNVSFQIPMMIVVVVLSSFQGVYRPMFSRLLGEGRIEELRTAFLEVSKVQAALLLPAGTGLALLLPTLIPLLFGAEFAPAVPLALVLCAGLFLEAALNLGTIVLSVDHRYRAVMLAQLLRVVAAPLFVGFAANGQLLLATAFLASGRVTAVAVGYLLARSRYAVRLPVRFVARLAVPTAIMPWPSQPPDLCSRRRGRGSRHWCCSACC